jgi:hypothetical protein
MAAEPDPARLQSPTLLHNVKKILNFVVDEYMYAGESSTSRLIF